MPTSIVQAEAVAPPEHHLVDGELRFLIRNVGWSSYQKLLEAFEDSGPRIAYLNGSVELMTVGARHERRKKIFARMVEDLIVELDIFANALGSKTFKKQSGERGVEPDESYYLANAGRVSDRAEIDLEFDPPPDLVIEVEVSSPLLEQLAIYAGLGVPEIWRDDNQTLTVLLLQLNGSYLGSTKSRAFPFLPMDAFSQQFRSYTPSHETQWARAYRAWVARWSLRYINVKQVGSRPPAGKTPP